jgi:hypothetical protein
MRAPVQAARIALPAVAAILSFAAVSACSDLDRVFDVAFPPVVPGLTDGQAWLDLPIGSWVHDGDIQATAMAACFARACPSPGAVALFQAEGGEAALLAELIAHPDRLKAALARPDASRKRARRPVAVEVVPLQVAALHGFAIRIARADGSRPAYGAVLARPGADGRLGFVLAVAPGREAAQRLAEAAASGLS